MLLHKKTLMKIKTTLRSGSGIHREISYHNIFNLGYKTPKEIPAVSHNSSNYDYYFIVRELAEEFEEQFKFPGENTQKFVTFSVPIKKEPENDNTTLTYKIDSVRFMSSSLSSLAVVITIRSS